jgi:hypothetical protein
VLQYVAGKLEKNDVSESVKIKDGFMSFEVGGVSSSYKVVLYPAGISVNVEVLADGYRWKRKHANK